MVALAVAGNPLFVASDLEMRREGPSYTIDTVTRLEQDRPGDEVVLVLGSDAFAEIGTWHDALRLLERVEIAVVPRPGQTGDAVSSDLPVGARGARVVQGTALDISSTEIRALARGGGSIRYLVPDGVEDYITKRGLYR
jgi:nicotinate-nucleotide adenylyltransferase